jgi:hypothetical protein
MLAVLWRCASDLAASGHGRGPGISNAACDNLRSKWGRMDVARMSENMQRAEKIRSLRKL